MAATVDLRQLLTESGVGEVLDELDRELIGLLPVKTRIREIASLLVSRIAVPVIYYMVNRRSEAAPGE